MDYYNKYLKYKNKYLQLKGGEKFITINLNILNGREIVIKLKPEDTIKTLKEEIQKEMNVEQENYKVIDLFHQTSEFDLVKLEDDNLTLKHYGKIK